MGIVKTGLYRIASKSWLSYFSSQPIFPYYHIVNDEKVEHISHLYPYKNKQQFEHDIAFLLKNYKSLQPQDLLNSAQVPRNRFLITFDDGLEEVYSVIYPILKKNNVPAIFFINPDYVGNQKRLYKHDISIIITQLENSNFPEKQLDEVAAILDFSYSSPNDFISKIKSIKYADRAKIAEVATALNIDLAQYQTTQKPFITKSQIQEMIDGGFYFGGHTMSHPPLNQIGFDEQKREIIESIDWLKANFGIAYSMFAFPFTDRGISKKLIDTLFEYDANLRIFGNAGIKKDIDARIIQRFSLENPDKETAKQIVTENLYKIFNKLVGNYHIKRK